MKCKILLPFLILTACSQVSKQAEIYEKIPFYFVASSACPIIDIEIEGVKYPFELDLGFVGNDISIQPAVLEKICSKAIKGTSNFSDVRGNLYTTNQFWIPSLRVQNFEIKDICGDEESAEFLNNVVVYSGDEIEESTEHSSICAGRVGVNLFETYVCTLDFSKSALFLSPHVDETISNRWIRSELVVSNNFGLISFETDLGKKTFLVDTGASSCLFKESLIDKQASIKKNTAKKTAADRWIFRTFKMGIGNADFGEQRFVLLEFKGPFAHVDGILGIDFLKKHPICFDFQNNVVYLEPPAKSIWERLLGW
jgi:hypothetical protein